MYHNDRKGGFENEKNLQTNYRPSYADSGFVHLGLCWADILLRIFVPFGQRACFIPWGSGSAYILCQERSDSTDHCVPGQPYGHPLDRGLGTGKAPEFVPRTERDIIECSGVIMAPELQFTGVKGFGSCPADVAAYWKEADCKNCNCSDYC